MQSSLLTDSGLEHVIIFKNKKCDLRCSIENRKHLLIPYFCHHDQINIQEIIFLEKISLETSWVSVYPASPQLRHGTRPRFIDFSLSLGVIQAKAASRFTNIHGGCWILVGEKIDGFQNVFALLPWLLKGLSTGNYQTQSLPLRCGKIISQTIIWCNDSLKEMFCCCFSPWTSYKELDMLMCGCFINCKIGKYYQDLIFT